MRFKKVKALIVAGVMTLTSVLAVPATANAAHRIPGGGGMLCDNSYYYYVETSTTSVYYIAPHKLTDGRICNRARMSYAHEKICTGCLTILDRSTIFQCTEMHSACSNTSKSCR